jgi:hypothetical protein
MRRGMHCSTLNSLDLDHGVLAVATIVNLRCRSYVSSSIFSTTAGRMHTTFSPMVRTRASSIVSTVMSLKNNSSAGLDVLHISSSTAALDVLDKVHQDRYFAAQPVEWHRQQRQALLRKVDWHMLPLLATIFMLSFLDRNALASARLSSLEEDLGMEGTQFNSVTSIFFVGYVLFQVPSNMVLTKLKPGTYLSVAAILWGTVSAAQAGCTNYDGLLAARFFLGVAEAPVFPGCLLLLSSWYTAEELAYRFAWFYSGAQLANAFGGLIAAGVLANLNGSLGVAAWQWLFILEGSATVLAGLIALFLLPNYPGSTKYLSDEEKAYAQWRLGVDAGDEDKRIMTGCEGLMLALKDIRVYIFVLLQHCSNLSQTFM